MDADWAVELGQEDPILEVPWAGPEGGPKYVDLRADPALLKHVDEAQRFPELGELLRQLNGARGALETVKCDAWESTEIEEAEEIFGGSHKVGSYCDVIFRGEAARLSFEHHEQFVRRWCKRLGQAPEIPAAIEFIVRRAVFHRSGKREGFCITVYVFGYGEGGDAARKQWEIALRLAGNAMMQAPVLDSR